MKQIREKGLSLKSTCDTQNKPQRPVSKADRGHPENGEFSLYDQGRMSLAEQAQLF